MYARRRDFRLASVIYRRWPCNVRYYRNGYVNITGGRRGIETEIVEALKRFLPTRCTVATPHSQLCFCSTSAICRHVFFLSFFPNYRIILLEIRIQLTCISYFAVILANKIDDARILEALVIDQLLEKNIETFEM